MIPPRLIVGLGNPGGEYEDTRHNLGFWFVERLARELKVNCVPQGKFFGHVGRDGETWLLMPTTFMNRSGQAVAALARFYKIAPAEILVVHDELDLPPGGIRLKQGGNGGHNGLKDIQAQLGCPISGACAWASAIPASATRSSITSSNRRAAKNRPKSTRRSTACLLAWPKLAAGDYAAAQRQLHGKV